MKFFFLFLITLLFGCQSVVESRKEVSELQATADHLRTTNFQLDQTRESLLSVIELENKKLNDARQDETVVQAEKAQKGVHYILHVSIRQISYSLSISKQLRDAVNEEEFDLPTDKVTYDHANVGDDLFDSFRAGSAFFRGSLGSWRLKIVGKRVQLDG